MTTVTATTSQHDNGASRPFAFLPKRRRSKTHPHTSHHEGAYELINDNDDNTTVHPDDTASSASTSTPMIPQKHIFPTKTAIKQAMHIDIPEAALITSTTPIAPPTFIRKKSGELVKPSLKSTSSFAPGSISPPSPSSGSTRPRTTSAPATPSASKSVHFDTQLEHVKLFLAGQKPLAVSREGSPVDMDTTSASEAEPDSFGISSYPFPSFKPKPRFGSSTASTANSSLSSATSGLKPRPQTRMKLKLIQIYTPSSIPNPAVEPWSFDVRVESVRLSNSDSLTNPSDNAQDAYPTLHGTILVHNKAFAKTVFFRYTLDDWNTVSEVSCKHVHTLPGGMYDRFEYRVKLIGLSNNRVEGERASIVPFKPGSGSVFGAASSRTRLPYRMEFCVRYNVPGWGEWWDSNGGRNYVVEFEWESESVSSAQQQQSTKIVSPQPQRVTSNSTASPLLQRLARHSLPVSSLGTASPGHISPPPHTGPGSASMLDQRPPMPSPSFPPSSYGHSDYFNYHSNKPQAMNIPLRSRYDFGVSLREGAKIMGPAVTSPPPAANSSSASGSRSRTIGFSGLPKMNGGNEISLPVASRILSPTPVHGQFRHALATPGKKLSSPPAVDLAKDKEGVDESSPSSPPLLPESGPSTSEVTFPLTSPDKLSPASSSTVLPADASVVSHPVPLSPSGRRHVRSWLKPSMSDQYVSGSDSPSKIHVRKTMSSPAGFAADESVSPPSSQVNFQQQQQQQEQHAGPSHEQHHIDGDEDDESEEDGIWFGRRSSSSNGGIGDNGNVASDVTQSTQSDYDVVTNAMRLASPRTSPVTRFQDLDVVLEDDEDVKDMEMGDSSSSSHSSSSVSSPTDSLTDLKEQTEQGSGVTPSSSSPTSSPTMTSSTMWSLTSGDTKATSSSSSSGVSLTPRVSTPSQFESRTLPLFNAKLARAVLSGTPRSASPSLDGTEIMPPPPSSLKTLKTEQQQQHHFPLPVLMSSPSSDGSVTPKGEMLSSLGSDAEASSKGINLNSSSYYSLLNQFCFFTGSPSRPSQTQTQAKNQPPTKQNVVTATEQTRERSPPRLVTPPTGATSETATDRNSRSLEHNVRRGIKGVVGQQQSRSSSAEPSYPSSSSSSASYALNPGFGFSIGFGLDGLGSMNDTYHHHHNHHHLHPHHHPGLPYGMLKSLGRSFSDPAETFPVRPSFGEQVSGGVS